MIYKYWPDVRIVNARLRNKEGEIDIDGEPDNEEIYKVAELADFFISGSGGGIMEGARWLAKRYKKPYGAYGVTISNPPPSELKAFIDNASLNFTRDTDSLENLKKAKVRCKIAEFAPDASFSNKVEDDQKATVFMNKHGLEL